MGAWIEINGCWRRWGQQHCRTPRWVRGLKSYLSIIPARIWRRTPRWVRGLKFCFFGVLKNKFMSHPTMGAWIEISSNVCCDPTAVVAPHDGCVDWNSTLLTSKDIFPASHPTMGAWIEIEQMKGMRQGLFGRTPRWVRGLKSCLL